MIDLVTLYLANRGLPVVNGQVLSYTPSLISGERGLRIRPFLGGSVLQGSLAKLIHGQNVTAVTAAEIARGIAFLEESLGWQLQDAPVYQLEVGFTFAVTYEPRVYLGCWSGFGRFKLDSIADNETVKLWTKRIHFIGYDKRKEVVSRRGTMPSEFPGYHALRLELKCVKHAAVQSLLGKELFARDLASPELIEALKIVWKDFYFKIPKKRLSTFDLSSPRPSDLKDALAHRGILGMGRSRVLQRIGEYQSAGRCTKQAASRMRRMVRELEANQGLGDSSKLTQEIDDLVASA